jgi:hypothetical protein
MVKKYKEGKYSSHCASSTEFEVDKSPIIR